jgi:hypothetical protein
MDADGYLTPDEARAQGVRWRPRRAAPTERRKELERLQHAEVRLPDLSMIGWSGWLCRVCRRAALRNSAPWSWYGCGSCRMVDARAAAALGGQRLLPLGQHSIMNGASIRMSMLEGPGRDAKVDQLDAISEGWRQLDEWCVKESERLVAEVLDRFGRVPESVPYPQWQEWFPSSRTTSADALSRLLREHQPSLIDVEPRLGDLAWLLGGRPDE